MQPHLGNTLERRLTSYQRAVCNLGLVALVVLGLLAGTQVAYAQTVFTITASVSGAGGSIVPNGTTNVNSGGNLTININPDPGYLVSDVLVDGVSVGAATLYTFNNVQANHTIQATFAAGSHSLTLLFDQSAYPGDVWLQAQDASQGFAATYGSGQSIIFQNPGDMMSVPVKLSDIGAGGLNVTYANGVVLFVFYDDPTTNDRTAAPAYRTSQQRFMPFELTMTGGSGNQGDLTAINYFTAPLSLRSYRTDPTQNPPPPALQQTGFGGATAAQIGARFAAATGGNPAAVVKDANGNIVRYLGPSDFTGANPWPSFIPYVTSLNTANNQTTHIQSKPQGFYFNADNTVVYNFGVDMTATADANGNLTITGGITASVTGTIKTGNPPLPPGGQWNDTTLYFSTAVPHAFNSAIYGQVSTSAVQFWGSGWIYWVDFLANTLLDPSIPYDPVNNPSLLDGDLYPTAAPPPVSAPVYQTVFNNSIGEITTGLLGGFYNSDYQVNGVALKNMPSHQWWSLNPIVAYQKIQPQNPYYNPYSGVIFNTSGNTVYGVPYTDRFGTGPDVNSVNYPSPDGVTYYVNYWVMGIGAPLPATIASPGMLLLLLE